MTGFIQDFHNIIKQCQVYKSLLEEELRGNTGPALWASKLGVLFVPDSELEPDMMFDYMDGEMWKNITRCIEIHSSQLKLRYVFKMSNGKSVGLRLTDAKAMLYHSLLRRFIELEEDRGDSTLHIIP